jgi:hypothetical protein
MDKPRPGTLRKEPARGRKRDVIEAWDCDWSINDYQRLHATGMHGGYPKKPARESNNGRQRN